MDTILIRYYFENILTRTVHNRRKKQKREQILINNDWHLHVGLGYNSIHNLYIIFVHMTNGMPVVRSIEFSQTHQ